MSTQNLPPNRPSARKRRPAMIIAMIPLGTVLGFHRRSAYRDHCRAHRQVCLQR